MELIISTFDKFVEVLKNKLSEPLPGQKAHLMMMPENRPLSNGQKAKKAAVVLLIYPVGNNIKFVAIKRVEDNTPHSGQISLPGGQYENTDKTLWNTAKRETYEEIGIKLSDDNLLGKLTNLYIPVSNFDVYPFVAYYRQIPRFTINKSEVQEILHINIQNFFYENNIVKKIFYSNKKILKAPAFKYKNYYIWGATAMILNEFYYILKNTQ